MLNRHFSYQSIWSTDSKQDLKTTNDRVQDRAHDMGHWTFPNR